MKDITIFKSLGKCNHVRMCILCWLLRYTSVIGLTKLHNVNWRTTMSGHFPFFHHTSKKERWYHEKMWGHFHFYTIQQRNEDGIMRRCSGHLPFYTAQQRNKDGIMRRCGILGKKWPSFMEGLHYLPLLKMQKLVKVIWADNVNTYTLCLHMPMWFQELK